MKISIVTITYRDGLLLARTRRSVLRQILPQWLELEHVIVTSDEDFDETLVDGARIIRRSPCGCYDAMNTGLEACTGDVLGLLHGNDFYADEMVLADVAAAFAEPEVGMVFGDVYFTRADGTGRSRYYSTTKFRPKLLENGFMPPHPSFFMRREVFEETGPYSLDYEIASDFEYMLRVFNRRPEYGYRRIGRPLVAMSPGGLASLWRNRLFFTNYEKYRALKRITGSASFFKLLGRYYYHFFQ